MKRLIGRFLETVNLLWNDPSGIMLPYVAVVLPAILGFSLLAVDAARYASLQTQMQGAADALALAGARELDKEAGAQARAISAMANTSFGNANTLFGMGSAPIFTYTYAFYQSLPAATANLAGATVATTDFNSKYVSVTLTPVTIPTIFPVKLIMPSGANSFNTGAQAVAGFQGVTVCSAAPIFMCNPWETSGMTEAQATQTLYTNALTPTFQRHQFKFLRQDNNAGPGHFGWVNPPNGGNSTPGMEQWAASTYGACYSSALIKLLPGNRPVIDQYIDVRFDIYNKYGPSADYAPAINVRKGYLPDKNANWCNASSADQVKNMVTNVTSPYLTTPVLKTTGDITNGGKQIKNVPAADIAKVQVGQVIVHNPCGFPASTCTTYSQIKIPAKAYVLSKSGTTINIGGGVTASATLNGTPLIIQWETSGLPHDQSWPNLGGQEGDGNWDCASYWSINFANVYANLASPLPPPAAPAGCTASSPTISRYELYRYEIANSLHSFGNGVTSPTGWSGNGLAGNVKNSGSGESGAPYCAAASGVSGVDTTTGGVDRRILLVPIINCHAQNIAGGNNGYASAAAFAKYFLTQPYSYDGTYLWGEIAGLVGTGDNVVIANQVQLYR